MKTAMRFNLLPSVARLLLLLPQGLFTMLVTAAIFWLTLAPDPLPDNDIQLFPGFDKVAHACMFGGLYFAAAFDLVARHRGKGKTHLHAALPPIATVVTAVASIAFGGLIELVQEGMNMGRGCDLMDFVADIAGVVIAVLLTPVVLHAMLKEQ